MIGLGHWYGVKDGDHRALGLYQRHYSRYVYADGRRPNQFIGPGASMALMTTDGLALWVWRDFINDAELSEGINCAVFRNEGPVLSSLLIREAVEMAWWWRWPGQRLYTYVNPKRLPPGKRPGYCFEAAGWRRCGITKKRHYLIFELTPTMAASDDGGR